MEESKKGRDIHMVKMQQEVPMIPAQPSGFDPVRNVEVEIGQSLLPAILAFDDKVGLHTYPIGVVELQLDKSEVSAHEYAQHIWHSLSEKINDHLRQDGLPPLTGLDAAGPPNSSTPRCNEARERFLADAPFV